MSRDCTYDAPNYSLQPTPLTAGWTFLVEGGVNKPCKFRLPIRSGKDDGKT